MRFLTATLFALLGITACSSQPDDAQQSAGCFSVDECFDVNHNNYKIHSEGYMVRAEGVHLPSDQPWELVMIKQQDSGFVRGINEGDDYHWEERIEIAYDPEAVADPVNFSKLVTRVCENGQCQTITE